MYIALVAAGMCATYVVLYFAAPLFFGLPVRAWSRHALLSMLAAASLVVLVYAATDTLTDLQLGNRLLHTFGGGFLGVFMCWRVARDAALPITRFQFLVLAGLVATSLGVANELTEFFLQNFSSLTFARTADDTWFDLLSNLVGTGLGMLVFLPLIPRVAK